MTQQSNTSSGNTSSGSGGYIRTDPAVAQRTADRQTLVNPNRSR